MTRTGDFVYLRTCGSLDIDHDTNEVRSFVCHNILVDEEEGQRLVKEMKKKYAIMISENEYSVDDGDPGVENPVQLERAILSLITGLKPGSDPFGSPPTEVLSSTDEHDSDTSRSGKTPPISIIPPQPSSIKTTISKSTNIVESASKNMRGKSPRTSSDDESNRGSQSSPMHRFKGKPFERSDDEQSVSSRSSQRSEHRGKFMYDEDDVAKIKSEPTEARVPPLPQSAGYFDMDSNYGSPNSYLEGESLVEYKPFDLLPLDEAQATCSQRVSSSLGAAERTLKRTRSGDSTGQRSSKQRLISNAETNDSESELDIKPNFSMHSTYINQLNDPNSRE